MKKIRKNKKSNKSGRGRPKGSKNKNKARKEKKEKKVKEVLVDSGNRGYAEISTSTHNKLFAVPEGYKEPKGRKFLGYCCCDFIITEADIVSKNIYLCPGCLKSGKVKGLNKEAINVKDRPKSKKEYLENAVFSTKVIEDSAPVEIVEEEIIPEVEDIIKGEDKEDEEGVVKGGKKQL